MGLQIDYLIAAHSYLDVAELALNGAKDPCFEGYLENPILFLLGHAAELIIKAAQTDPSALSPDKTLEHHRLLVLCDSAQKLGVTFDPDFLDLMEQMDEGFSQYRSRYPRVFSGAPEGDSVFQNLLNSGDSKDGAKLYKNYGLGANNLIDKPNALIILRTQLYKIDPNFKDVSPLRKNA